MTFHTLGNVLTDQYVTVTVVIKDNNMWWKDTIVTKGHNILWRFSILSSQGTLCDGRYMTTGMTLLFCHKTLFMTNFVLTMIVCLCHTNQYFCSAPSSPHPTVPSSNGSVVPFWHHLPAHGGPRPSWSSLHVDLGQGVVAAWWGGSTIIAQWLHSVVRPLPWAWVHDPCP